MLEQVCYVSLIVFISYIKDTSYFGFKAAVLSMLNGFVFYRWEWLLYTFGNNLYIGISIVKYANIHQVKVISNYRSL